MNQEERDIWMTAAFTLPSALAAANNVQTAHMRLRELELHDREHKLQVADAVEAAYLDGRNPAQDEKVREISAAAPDARRLLGAQKRFDIALLYFRSKLSSAMAPVHSATNQKLLDAIAGLRQDFADFRRDAASSKHEIMTIAALGVIQEWNTRAKERNLMAYNAYHYALRHEQDGWKPIDAMFAIEDCSIVCVPPALVCGGEHNIFPKTVKDLFKLPIDKLQKLEGLYSVLFVNAQHPTDGAPAQQGPRQPASMAQVVDVAQELVLEQARLALFAYIAGK